MRIGVGRLAATLSLLRVAGALFEEHLTQSTFQNAHRHLKGMVDASFVKFWVPWCDVCAQMAPAWDAIGDEREGSLNVLVGSVDCSRENKPLCERFNVTAYPTLLYFMPPDPDGEFFEDVFTEKVMGEFATALVDGVCYPAHVDRCDESGREALDKLGRLGVEKVRRLFGEARRARREARAKMKTLYGESVRAEDAYEAVARGSKSAKRGAEVAMSAARDKAAVAAADVRGIEVRHGRRYMQMKAFLAPHGGLGGVAARGGVAPAGGANESDPTSLSAEEREWAVWGGAAPESEAGGAKKGAGGKERRRGKRRDEASDPEAEGEEPEVKDEL